MYSSLFLRTIFSDTVNFYLTYGSSRNKHSNLVLAISFYRVFITVVSNRDRRSTAIAADKQEAENVRRA